MSAFARAAGKGDGEPEPPYKMIATRIGMRLRGVYGEPEAEPLPTEHVDLLLRLRHKERDRTRRED